jgi:hypothetical protein
MCRTGSLHTTRSRLLNPGISFAASLIAVRHGIAERVAERLRQRQLIPQEEVNDSLVLAESALLECRVLLTSDEHLRGIDFEKLTLELQAFDLAAPVIATPREIVRKFFLR